MRWNSLTTRLVVMFAAMILVVLLVITAFSYMRAKKALEGMLQSHGKTLISAMGTSAADQLMTHDYFPLRTYVADLVTKERVLSFAAAVNAEGSYVAHSDRNEEGKKATGIGDVDSGNAAKGTGVSEREIHYKENRILELSAPVVIAGKHWGTVLLGVNYKEVDSILRSIAMSISLAGLLTLALAVVGVLGITGKMTSGLKRLVESTRKLAGGELRSRAPEEGYEEIRVLAGDINTMAENLRSMLQQIQQTSSTVGEFSSNILTVIQDQATSASQQAASVSEVTATMEELSRTSHQIAGNAEEVKGFAAKSVEMAQHGTVLIRDGVGAMEQIKQRVGDIAKRNLFLGEKSQEIGKVMEIIKEIASEIHLLALNAAIESAAAGEHGRRFSVVASEVRRLAEKTRESTETIRSILSEIQVATGSSIQATEHGTQEVDRWRETIRRSSDAFEEIIQMVEKTLEASTQISLATHQQTSANEQVVQAMRQVAEMVRATATQMQRSFSSAGELKEVVAGLKEKTAVFQV